MGVGYVVGKQKKKKVLMEDIYIKSSLPFIIDCYNKIIIYLFDN